VAELPALDDHRTNSLNVSLSKFCGDCPSSAIAVLRRVEDFIESSMHVLLHDKCCRPQEFHEKEQETIEVLGEYGKIEQRKVMECQRAIYFEIPTYEGNNDEKTRISFAID
jgi:hypothetical protein